MKIDDVVIEINEKGGCLFNSTKTYKMAPEETISLKEVMFGNGLQFINSENVKALFRIPLVEDAPNKFRVDGRIVYTNTTYINYDGMIKIVSQIIDYRKNKKYRKREKV